MSSRTRLTFLTLGLALLSLSFAPAAPDDRPGVAALADARYQSARELFDEAWLLYTRKGFSEGGIYTLSVRLLTAQVDSAAKAVGRIAAYEAHLERMKKLQSMMTRLRGVGYTKKIEIKEVEYFVHEARFWLARERAK